MVSIYDCIQIIWEEGSDVSPLKKKRMKDKIKKMSKSANWDNYVNTLDKDWQWRIACAKLHLGVLTWEGWEYRNIRNGMIPFNFPKWNKEPVDSLLIYGEQGIGDEIMFSQVLPELRAYAKHITFECMERLVPVFRRSFPWLTVVGRKYYNDGKWARNYDAQAALGDLLPMFRTKRSQFLEGPYLTPDPQRVLEFKEFKGKTGVSWWGRQARLQKGEFPPDYISLQYGDEAHDFVDTGIDLTNDIEGVLALTSVLERVVSVPTSIVHFAGSMGTKVDVIQCPTKSSNQNSALNWRFSEQHNKGRKMIWHPTVNIFKNLEEYNANK